LTGNASTAVGPEISSCPFKVDSADISIDIERFQKQRNICQFALSTWAKKVSE